MLAILAAFALSAAHAGPQEVIPAADEGTICLSIAIPWHGGATDIRQIELVPIPDSYRARFEAKGGCQRYQLVVGDLVTWHIDFGSERSATAALAYLAQDYRRNSEPSRFLEDLSRAWRKSQPDLRAAAALKQPPGQSFSVRFRFMDRSPTIRKLSELLILRENYRFLAEQYLKAAEAFGSLALLVEADRYLDPVRKGEMFLGPLEAMLGAPPLMYFNLHEFKTDDLRARAAVLRAQLTRLPIDIAHADEILSSLNRPIYEQAAQSAYSGGKDFCDISNGWTYARQVEIACKQDNAFQQRVTSYWVNRAIADTLSSEDGPTNEQARDRSMRLAVRLLDIERSPQNSDRARLTVEDDLIRVRLAQADHFRGAAEALKVNDTSDAITEWERALEALEAALSLLKPYESPVPFQRIGSDWLNTWDGRREFAAVEEVDASRLNSSRLTREASFLRAVIASFHESFDPRN